MLQRVVCVGVVLALLAVASTIKADCPGTPNELPIFGDVSLCGKGAQRERGGLGLRGGIERVRERKRERERERKSECVCVRGSE